MTQLSAEEEEGVVKGVGCVYPSSQLKILYKSSKRGFLCTPGSPSRSATRNSVRFSANCFNLSRPVR